MPISELTIVRKKLYNDNGKLLKRWYEMVFKNEVLCRLNQAETFMILKAAEQLGLTLKTIGFTV